MNLPSRLKRAATLIFGFALTIVMFPILLATTSFLLITGFVGAVFAANRIRQFAKQVEQADATKRNEASKSEGQILEGSYRVVRSVSESSTCS